MQLLKNQLKKRNVITTSDAPLTVSSKAERAGLKLIDPNLKGDLAEHYAITWLWDEGFQVFKNAGCTGLVDLIAMKDGEIFLFDVKMGHPSKRTAAQKKLGVQFILFDAKTRGLRLMNHRKLT